MSPFDSSVASRLAQSKYDRVYMEYIQLLRSMGPIKTVYYNIEDLAYAQSQMKKIRAVDRIKSKNKESQEDKTPNWSELLGLQDDWMDFEVYENPLTYVSMMHPIFLFSHHSRGHDHGHNQIIDLPVRGDSMSIPIVSEGGEVYFISIGFHKGDMSVFFSFFPERPDSVREELSDLLRNYETR